MHSGNQSLSCYQKYLAALLRRSTLTPGRYEPSAEVRKAQHIGVFANGHPVILCGLADDPSSVEQANKLAGSMALRSGLSVFDEGGELRIDVMQISGQSVQWKDKEFAVVSKPSGQVEDGSGSGDLVAIVCGANAEALSVLISVTTETARIFDSEAPELDDGQVLSLLARKAEQLSEQCSAAPSF